MNALTTADIVQRYLQAKSRSTERKTWTFRASDVTDDHNIALSVAHWLRAQVGMIIFGEYKLTEISWSRKRGRRFRVVVIDDDYLY